MSPELDRDMDRILAAAQRAAAPRTGDRERIASALRSRLTAGMVGGSARGIPAAASTSGVAGASAAKAELGRSGWLTIVTMTSLLTGAFGFALGYTLRDGRDAAAASPGAEVSAQQAVEGPARHAEGDSTEELVVGGGRGAAGAWSFST